MENLSKFLSLILRHKPQVVDLTLDEHGWVDVYDLIHNINDKTEYEIDIDLLRKIVESDSKQRYSFSDDGSKIRANQGHSIPVDVELEEVKPTFKLYHGTGKKYVNSINTSGLIPKSRLYVHLSIDYETAVNVGKRHGEPVVYVLDTEAMLNDNFKFYKSANNVYLTKTVPTKYLSLYDESSNEEK